MTTEQEALNKILTDYFQQGAQEDSNYNQFVSDIQNKYKQATDNLLSKFTHTPAPEETNPDYQFVVAALQRNPMMIPIVKKFIIEKEKQVEEAINGALG